MSAMDDVFGVNPARPEHPDLWRISEVLLRNDGAIDDATKEEKGAVWRGIVDPVVDKDSLLFMAEQRVRRVFGPMRYGTPEEIALRGKLVTLALDGFITGAMYQAAGGHRETYTEGASS